MEAEELQALGFSDKAHMWMTALHRQREKRHQAVQERAATYRANEFERSTVAGLASGKTTARPTRMPAAPVAMYAKSEANSGRESCTSN